MLAFVDAQHQMSGEILRQFQTGIRGAAAGIQNYRLLGKRACFNQPLESVGRVCCHGALKLRMGVLVNERD